MISCSHYYMMSLVREEEEYDHRSLYERLKSQKDKAEADKAEQFKFSEFVSMTVLVLGNITILP